MHSRDRDFMPFEPPPWLPPDRGQGYRGLSGALSSGIEVGQRAHPPQELGKRRIAALSPGDSAPSAT